MARRWGGHDTWFVAGLAGVGLLWLGLRLVFFTGYYAEDAPGYITDAIDLALGTYHARAHILGLNVGTYAPVAVPLALLGKTDAAVAIWPLLCSFLGLSSLACAATLLFGRRFGLLATLLYATYPGDVFFSTVVMPDAIQAGWLAFSMCLVVAAWAGPDTRRLWLLGSAGIAMGVVNLVRANGVLLAPIGLVTVWVLGAVGAHDRAGRTLRALAAYASGWMVVFVGEGLVYLWAVGDFLHRIWVVDRHYGSMDSITRWGLNTSWATIPFSIFPPVAWWRIGDWGRFNEEQAYHGILFCLAAAAVSLAVPVLVLAKARLTRRVAAGFLIGLFWAAWPLLVHEFGSQSLTHYVPMHRLSRHLVVYAPGAIFTTVAGCALFSEAAARWRSAWARRATLAAGLLLVVLHVGWSWQCDRVSNASFHRVEDTYLRIRHHLPPDLRTMVADPGDLCFFDFWLNPLGQPRVQLVPFAAVSRCEDLPDNGVVLTRSNAGWEGLAAPVIRETVQRLPCLVQPPAAWHLLYDGFPERVYVVHRQGPGHSCVHQSGLDEPR